MDKKKIILTALILAVTASAALTSCGGNDGNANRPTDGKPAESTPDQGKPGDKETEGSPLDKVESGIEDIGSDIQDSITHPEDATHGKPEDEESPLPGTGDMTGGTEGNTGSGTEGNTEGGTSLAPGKDNGGMGGARRKAHRPFAAK